jgi:threonine synthase
MMGAPLRKLICASNSNNSLTELINTGYYNIASRGTKAKRTVSPAIDILRASNIERYIFHATRQNATEVTRLYRDLEMNGRFQVSSEVIKTQKVCEKIS